MLRFRFMSYEGTAFQSGFPAYLAIASATYSPPPPSPVSPKNPRIFAKAVRNEERVVPRAASISRFNRVPIDQPQRSADSRRQRRECRTRAQLVSMQAARNDVEPSMRGARSTISFWPSVDWISDTPEKISESSLAFEANLFHHTTPVRQPQGRT